MIRTLLTAIIFAPVAAFAQSTDATAMGAAGSPLASFLPLVLIFFVFYFLLIKPQQKRLKEHQQTIAALKKGDEVITGGGIVGKITKVAADDTVTVEIAKGVEVTVLKSTVTGLKNPVKAPAPEKKKSGSEKNDNTVPSRDSIANDN